MSVDARARIETHRLMQTTGEAPHSVRIDSTRHELNEKKKESSRRWKRRAKVHTFIFLSSFIFSVGVFTLGTLLWVEPDDLFSMVIVSVLSSIVFVVSFAWSRMLILHTLFNDYSNKEEDPGMTHHLTKSIAYGFVALVLALVFASLIVNIASAGLGT